MKYKIVVDSSSDLDADYLKGKDIGFEIVPLSIRVGEKEFVDKPGLETGVMLDEMKAYSGKSTTACPSPGDFMESFKGADNVFCITITSKLSGTYNSACVGRDMAKEEGMNNVFVIDSKAVSGVMILIVDEIVRLIEAGESYENICKKITAYVEEKELFFVLQSFDNLIKNGRVSKITGLIASALGIKPLCVAKEGDIKIFEKIRNAKKSLARLVEHIGEVVADTSKRECVITECDAKEEADFVRENIEKKYKFKKIRVIPMKGLSSFYALRKGVIVCF